MHYLTYVFIPRNTNIREAVAKAMEPFNEYLEVEPWKLYLDQAEIAAMAKCYGVRRTSIRKLVGHMENWRGGKGGVDEKGLYALLTYNPNGKWDWYEIGGRWDNFLPGNVITANSLLRSPKLGGRFPHDFLSPDGAWHEVERVVGKGWRDWRIKRKSDRKWLNEFKRALASWPQHKVVCVDCHR